MAIPLQTQLFHVFLGEETGIHSIALPDIFSSGGCKNLWIDRFGRAKKISGFAKQNTAAITTNVGATATRLRALCPYRTVITGTTTRQLVGVFDDAVDEWEIWTSTNDGVAWTFRYDAGSGSINTIPDFAQFGNNLFICNGVVVPRKWDGTTMAASGRTQSPTPAAAALSTTGNLVGVYKWKLISVFTDGTRKAGSLASGVLSRQDNQATVTWTADTDTTVGGYEIYRTTGSGEIYYFTSYVDGRLTASFTDNVADLTILENRIIEEHGDAPPSAAFCEPHKQRMWWGRTSANPARAFWSDAGLPEDVGLASFLDFTDSETIGDVLTGMLGNFDGRLVVFTERAIWTVSGSGNVVGNIVDWNRIHTNAQTGCPTHRAAVRMPAGVKYADQDGKIQMTTQATIAYLSSLGDIRLFDGEADIIISFPQKTLLDTFNYTQRAKSYCVQDKTRGEVIWVFPAGTAAEPDTAVVWNYYWGIWYPRGWTTFAHVVEIEISSDASVLLAGEAATATGGFCYLLWSTAQFNAVNFNARWMTKTLYGRMKDEAQLSQRKRWRWVDLLLATAKTATLTIEWLPGHSGDDDAPSGTRSVSTATGYLVDAGANKITNTTGADALVLGGATVEVRIPLTTPNGRYLHHEGIRLRIGDTADSGEWAIEAMNLAYQVLPGTLRRMQG